MLIQLTPLLAKCDCCGNYYDSIDTEDHLSVQEAIEEMVADGWADIDGKLYCPDCYEYNEDTDEYEVKKCMQI